MRVETTPCTRRTCPYRACSSLNLAAALEPTGQLTHSLPDLRALGALLVVQLLHHGGGQQGHRGLLTAPQPMCQPQVETPTDGASHKKRCCCIQHWLGVQLLFAEIKSCSQRTASSIDPHQSAHLRGCAASGSGSDHKPRTPRPRSSLKAWSAVPIRRERTATSRNPRSTRS